MAAKATSSLLKELTVEEVQKILCMTAMVGKIE
jgi:hypothetical protein